MVPLQFEVTLNGRRVCLAGMDREGVVMVTVHSENWPGPDPDTSTRGTRAGEENMLVVDGYNEDDDHMWWADAKIGPGDEIRIRVLSGCAFDPPRKIEPPCEAGDDPDD